MNSLTIGQLDLSSPYDTFVPSGLSGSWKRTLYLSATDKAACFWETLWAVPYDSLNSDPLIIGSVTADARPLLTAGSINELATQDNSFYWDNTNQTIYISFDLYNQYYMFGSITLGESFSFVNRAQLDDAGFPTDSTLDGFYFDPRLKTGTVNDEQTADDLGQNKMTFDSFSFDIDTSDGQYDNVRPQVIGQGGRILYGESEDKLTFDDLEVIRFGVVTNVSYPDGNTLRAFIEDPRKSWANKVNTETLNQTLWPNLDDKNVDKFIPLVIGTQDNVPTVQVDTTKFLFSTETYGDVTASTVYVDKVSTSFTDNLDGTVTISGYTDGDVTIDAVGIDKGNIAEIVIWLLDEFIGLQYNTTNYNTTEVQEIIDAAYDGGIYFGTDGTSVQEAIDFLLGSINARIYTQSSKYTMRDLNDRTPVYELSDDELLKIPAPWEFDSKSFFSSIRVKYRKQWEEKEYYELFDNSKRSEALENNAVEVPFEIETALRTSTNAQSIATQRYLRGILAQQLVHISLATSITAELYDYIYFTHNRRGVSTPITERAIYEVIAISKINKTMTLLYIEDSPAPPAPIVIPIGAEEMFNDDMFNDNFMRGTL
ncbi:hypothetical protein DRQ25_09105 [Candidatus Fermentibacteria bacterium]|nr:MAG: hypothetical protein DRQ25_09105 [Candidatus Fermentibacteria bacterium]